MQKENSTATKILELAREGYEVKPVNKRGYRLDAWENPTTGFGTASQHAVVNTNYSDPGRIPQAELEGLYRSDWVARKVIDAPSEDATRKGILYEQNDDDENLQKSVEDFDELLTDRYQWLHKAFEAVSLSRLSGGSVTVFCHDDIETKEDFRTPLNENIVSDVKWVKTFPSWYAIPLSGINDITDPEFGDPDFYQVIIREPFFGGTLNVHRSRLIRMDGRFTTQAYRALNRGYYDSHLQALYDSIRNYGVAVESSSATMQDFNYKTLGVKGLADKVMHREDDLILKRIQLAGKMMTSSNIAVYDAEGEKIEKHSTTVTGLSELWDRHAEAICGGSGIPRSRFFSSESGALGGNAAVSDLRNYYDVIKSFQKRELRPYLNEFMNMVNIAHEVVAELPKYDFAPLWEQSEKEKAETREIQMRVDTGYIQSQVITPEEVAVSRFSTSTPDLEPMNVDFEERKEQEKLEDEMNFQDEMRGALAQITENTTPEENETEIEEEEREDSKQPINVNVNVEPQNIEVNTPEIKYPEKDDSLEKEIRERLDKIESGKMSEDIKNVSDKIDSIKEDVKKAVDNIEIDFE